MNATPRSAPRGALASPLARASLFVFAAAALLSPAWLPLAPESRLTLLVGSYVVGVAKASAWLIACIETGVFSTDTGLIVGRYALQIVLDCAALDVHALYLAAALAFPSSWARKTCAALLGSVLIALCNLLRIGALYFVGLHAPERFDLLHEDVLALLMVVAAVATFHTLLVRGAATTHFARPTGA